jgi:hypothetical protein
LLTIGTAFSAAVATAVSFVEDIATGGWVGGWSAVEMMEVGLCQAIEWASRVFIPLALKSELGVGVGIAGVIDRSREP